MFKYLRPSSNSSEITIKPLPCSLKTFLGFLALTSLLQASIAWATTREPLDEDPNISLKEPDATLQKAPIAARPNISKGKNDNATLLPHKVVSKENDNPMLVAQKASLKNISDPTPVAPNVDLKEVAPAPVPEPTPMPAPPQATTPPEDEQADSAISKQDKPEPSDDTPPPGKNDRPNLDAVEQAPFVFLGSIVPPATATRLAWSPKVTIAGLTTPTPVLVINGKNPGKTLCMTAAIHGDELNGVEIIRRVMYDIDPQKLTGKIIGVPIVNIKGFQRGSRYLSDRRDLNRNFPGDAQGSLAARIAHSLFNEVIAHCDALIDLHTGSLRRTNLLQVRADMSNSDVMQFTEGFDETVVVHSAGEPGMLRQAALDAGIIAITLEAGESMRLQEKQVKLAVKSINSLLQRQKMYSRMFSWGTPAPTYYRSQWIRANTGGILFSHVGLGHFIKKGGSLGTVTDPITNESSEIISPIAGRVIGMAVNQVVMPGFAAYHLGIEAPENCLATTNAGESTVLETEALEPQDLPAGECEKDD